jgi:hypothetical protein
LPRQLPSALAASNISHQQALATRRSHDALTYQEEIQRRAKNGTGVAEVSVVGGNSGKAVLTDFDPDKTVQSIAVPSSLKSNEDNVARPVPPPHGRRMGAKYSAPSLKSISKSVAPLLFSNHKSTSSTSKASSSDPHAFTRSATSTADMRATPSTILKANDNTKSASPEFHTPSFSYTTSRDSPPLNGISNSAVNGSNSFIEPSFHYVDPNARSITVDTQTPPLLSNTSEKRYDRRVSMIPSSSLTDTQPRLASVGTWGPSSNFINNRRSESKNGALLSPPAIVINDGVAETSKQQQQQQGKGGRRRARPFSLAIGGGGSTGQSSNASRRSSFGFGGSNGLGVSGGENVEHSGASKTWGYGESKDIHSRISVEDVFRKEMSGGAGATSSGNSNGSGSELYTAVNSTRASQDKSMLGPDGIDGEDGPSNRKVRMRQESESTATSSSSSGGGKGTFGKQIANYLSIKKKGSKFLDLVQTALKKN